MGISLTKYMLAVGGVDVPEKFNGTLTEIEAIINNGTIRQAIEGSVLDRGIDTPPASPASSDSYIVGSSPTGAWIGQAHKIAYWLESALAWQFIAPRPGWTIWVQDEAAYYRWSGSSWVLTNIQGFNQALNTTNNVTFASASITGPMSVGGTVDVSGTAHLWGPVNAYGWVTLHGTTHAKGPLMIGDPAGNEGGEFIMLKPASGTSLESNVVFDIAGDSFRIFTTVGGNLRLLSLNLAGLGGNSTLWHSDNDGSESGLDADTVDGLHASALGRYAIVGAWTALQSFYSTGAIANADPLRAYLEAYGTDEAFMAFHRPGVYGTYLGFDALNRLGFGGWSEGANFYQIWNEKGAPEVTLAEAQGGAVTAPRMWPPVRIKDAIQALGGGGAMVKIGAVTTAGAAQVDFDGFLGLSQYSSFLLVGTNMRLDTTEVNAQLQLRAKVGGVWVEGATSYQAVTVTNGTFGSINTSLISLGRATYNHPSELGCGALRLFVPGKIPPGRAQRFAWDLSGMDMVQGNSRMAVAGAVEAIRLFSSYGSTPINVMGTFTLYGIME